MSEEIIIGPNSCHYCGGEYGEHQQDCIVKQRRKTFKIQWHYGEEDRTYRDPIWRDIPTEEYLHLEHAEGRLKYWQSIGLPVEFRISEASL